MKYLDRFKARALQVGAAYTKDNEVAPKRPFQFIQPEHAAPVNVLVDVILACRMKGVEFDTIREQAEAWADYEWEQVEPLVEAARAARQQQVAA